MGIQCWISDLFEGTTYYASLYQRTGHTNSRGHNSTSHVRTSQYQFVDEGARSATSNRNSRNDLVSSQQPAAITRNTSEPLMESYDLDDPHHIRTRSRADALRTSEIGAMDRGSPHNSTERDGGSPSVNSRQMANNLFGRWFGKYANNSNLKASAIPTSPIASTKSSARASGKQFAANILRVLPFISWKQDSSTKSNNAEDEDDDCRPDDEYDEEAEDEFWERENELQLARRGDMASGRKSPLVTSSFIADSNLKYISGDGPSIGKSSQKQAVHPVEAECFCGLDLPPPGVLELLDIYYPSRFLQQLFMDLTSMWPQRTLQSNILEDKAISPENLDLPEIMLSIPVPRKILLGIFFPPRPYPFSRMQRVVERLIEENGYENRWSVAFREDSFTPETMGDFHDTLMGMLSKCPQIISLSFTCSNLPAELEKYSGLNIRFPINNKHHKHEPEQTAHLGHMAGHVPPNIRFLNFRGVLSSESIQALCILLKRHNYIYSYTCIDAGSGIDCGMSNRNSTDPRVANSPSIRGHVGPIQTVSKPVPAVSPPAPLSGEEAVDPNKYSSTATDGSAHSTYQLKAPEASSVTSPRGNPPTPEFSRSPRSTNTLRQSQEDADEESKSTVSTSRYNDLRYRNPLRPLKGLIGLAITHTTFNVSDIRYLLELLAVYGPNSRDSTSRPGHPSEAPSTPLTSKSRAINDSHGLYSTSPRGIRFLDVSYDRFGDTVCAEVVSAAAQGPLEGLDLSGNNIKAGASFLEAFTRTVARPATMSYLQHLRLADNHLTDKFVMGLLESLQPNETVASLDLSHNEIPPTINDQLRAFLSKNRGVRSLDLSHNRLNDDSMKCVYLGLLENETVLLLPLCHNTSQASSASELPLIQNQLKSNRAKYQKDIAAYNARCVDARTQAIFPIYESSDEEHEEVLEALHPTDADVSYVLSASGKSAVMASVDGHPAASASHSELLPVAETVGDELMSNSSSSGKPLAQSTSPSTTIAAIDESAHTSSDNLFSADSSVSPLLSITPHQSQGRSPKESTTAAAVVSHSNTTPPAMFHVFFSSPLAYPSGIDFHPLERLDYESERDTIIQVLTKVHRNISVCFQFATTDNLRTALSLGCRALHFSGHGHPQYVSICLLRYIPYTPLYFTNHLSLVELRERSRWASPGQDRHPSSTAERRRSYLGLCVRIRLSQVCAVLVYFII